MAALIMIAAAAPSARATGRYQVITGRVLKIDRKERQMIVADRASEKLYLVRVDKEATFQITFGRNSQMSAATLDDLDSGNGVRLNCTRDEKEHFAKLDGGREVIVMRAAH